MVQIDYNDLIGKIADHIIDKLPTRQGYKVVTSKRTLFRYRHLYTGEEYPKTFEQIRKEIVGDVWKAVVMRNAQPETVKDPLAAERVVLALKQSGKVRGEVKFSRGRFDVRLENESYRIYKRVDGFSALPGSLLGGSPQQIHIGPDDFAAIVGEFDDLIPEMDQKADEVYQAHKAEMLEIQKGLRAKEILDRAVRSLAEQFLKPLGIDVDYRFNDDGTQVKLDLQKKLELHLDIPAEQLAATLKDTESILSQMK